MKLESMILDGVRIILKAVIEGMRDNPDVNTEKAEATAAELVELLDEYEQAQKVLDEMQVD
jgi:hypothetical protein